ncbi:transmembrane sensor [Sphingomonas sp. UYAg733]
MSGHACRSDEAVRRDASDWVTLVHDPDSAVDRAAFEQWRMADPRHAQAYARAERAWDSAALLGQTSFGRVRGLPERRRMIDRPPVRYAFAAAAMLVVAILGLSVSGVRLVGPDRASQATELASRVGQIRKIALADGSTVTLDTDSVLHTAFSSNERRLYLSRGRARFVVAHDAARRFVVMAGSGSVIARGTIFDVAVAGNHVKVVLLRGVVEVRGGRSRLAASQPVTAQLKPGQQISYAAAEPLVTPQPASAVETQWPAGMLSFDRTRLADAIAQANRYSTTKISLANPSLNDLRLTGAYHVGDVAGLAESIAGSLGLHVARTKRGDLMMSAPPSAPAS